MRLMTSMFCVLSLSLSASAFAGDFCSQWATAKDCSETGCDWHDATQTCREPAQAMTDRAVWCEDITSPELCDARYMCEWQWDRCTTR